MAFAAKRARSDNLHLFLLLPSSRLVFTLGLHPDVHWPLLSVSRRRGANWHQYKPEIDRFQWGELGGAGAPPNQDRLRCHTPRRVADPALTKCEHPRTTSYWWNYWQRDARHVLLIHIDRVGRDTPLPIGVQRLTRVGVHIEARKIATRDVESDPVSPLEQ
jgi:hypothetical protein